MISIAFPKPVYGNLYFTLGGFAGETDPYTLFFHDVGDRWRVLNLTRGGLF